MVCGEATHGAARQGQAFGRANDFFCCNSLFLRSRPGCYSGAFCGNGVFLRNRPGRSKSNGFFCGAGLFLGNRPGRSNGFQIN